MSFRPIAVFDSGLGGLSVVRHLRQILPNESLVYFGDTARVPYGSKTRRTVANFSLELSRFLLQFDPKLIVAACNTSSALAMDDLRRELPVPVIGVVEPGAAAAVQRGAPGPIAVLGTEATIASDAYPAAIHAAAAATLPTAAPIEIAPIACPLFVPLVEEGRLPDDRLVRMVVADYLAPLKRKRPRAVVLGCTHYPLLRSAIESYLGAGVEIVDSGRETSLTVAAFLKAEGSLSAGGAPGSMRCFVSDNPVRFRRVGSRFLNEEISDVELVSAEEYIPAPLAGRERAD